MTVDEMETLLMAWLAVYSVLSLIFFAGIASLCLQLREEIRGRFRRPQVARNGEGRRMYERL